MKKLNKKTYLYLTIAAGLAFALVASGQTTSLLSEYSLQHSNSYSLVFEGDSGCKINFNYDENLVLKEKGTGWPIIQGASLTEADGVPECTGITGIKSQTAFYINAAVGVISLGILAISLKNINKISSFN